MVKRLDFISFPNSTIRLSNSDFFIIDCMDSLQTVFIVTVLPLHMEVPYESRLLVLCGLDINLFMVFLGFFLYFSTILTKLLGGGFGDVQTVQTRVGPCQHHITAELKILLVQPRVGEMSRCKSGSVITGGMPTELCRALQSYAEPRWLEVV